MIFHPRDIALVETAVEVRLARTTNQRNPRLKMRLRELIDSPMISRNTFR